MSHTTRRAVLAGGISTSLLGAATPAFAHPPFAAVQSADPDPQLAAVTAAGFTDEEAACWKLCGELAGAYMGLESIYADDRQHQADLHEMATAIHVIQTKLLARPTYRRYLEEIRSRIDQE